MKIVCRSDEPTKLIQDIDLSSLNDDARQRNHEMKSVIKMCNNLEYILPYDASCEDIKVDVKLSFLDDFVARAIQNGADVYCDDKMYTKKSDEKGGKCIFLHRYRIFLKNPQIETAPNLQ